LQGIYTLIIKVNDDMIRFTIRNKEFTLESGIYCYNGSALGKSTNIENRINWHLKKQKKVHWHIDRVTVNQQSEIIQIVFSESKREIQGECLVSQEMAKNPKFTVPIPKFGASDCKNNCPAHFFKFNSKVNPIDEVLTIYTSLNFSPLLKFQYPQTHA